MNRRQFLSEGVGIAAVLQSAGIATTAAYSGEEHPAAPSENGGMVAVLAELLFESSDSGPASSALAKLAAATLLEPGCIRYAVAQDLAEPGRFHLSEVWKDLSSLAGHFETAHMAAFSAEARALGYSAPYLKKVAVSGITDFRPSELKGLGRSRASTTKR